MAKAGASGKAGEVVEYNPVADMRNHLGAINQLLIESDALFSSSSDGKISIWDAKTRNVLHEFKGHSKKLILRDGILYCVSFGNFGSEPGTVHAYDLRRRQYVATYQGHFLYITDLIVDKDRLYTCSADKTCRSWDNSFENFKGGDPLIKRTKTIFAGHQDQVTCLQYDGQSLYSGSADATVRVWNLDGSCRATLTGHTAGITCMVLLAGTLYSSSTDETVRAWNVKDNTAGLVIKTKLPILSFYYQDEIVYCQTNDPVIASFSTKSGKALLRFEGHKAKITCFKLGHQHMYTGDAAGAVRRWNVKTGQCVGVGERHTDIVYSLLIVGHLLYSGSADTRILVWDVKHKQEEVSWADFLSGGSSTPAASAASAGGDADNKSTKSAGRAAKNRDGGSSVGKSSASSAGADSDLTGTSTIVISKTPSSLLPANAKNLMPWRSWPEFFAQAGLEANATEYDKIFQDNAIELDQAPDLTADLLKEMNLKMGHIMKIMNMLAKVDFRTNPMDMLRSM